MKNFDMDSEGVLSALSVAQDEAIETISEWTGTQEEAFAAVIAAGYDYDISRLVKTLPKLKRPTVEAAALAIARRVTEVEQTPM